MPIFRIYRVVEEWFYAWQVWYSRKDSKVFILENYFAFMFHVYIVGMHLVNCILIILHYLGCGESSCNPVQEQPPCWSSLSSEWHRIVYVYIYLCANVLKCYAKCISVLNLCHWYEHERYLKMHLFVIRLCSIICEIRFLMTIIMNMLYVASMPL